MSNSFQDLRDYFKSNPAVVAVALLGLSALIVGINHFAEDQISSYWGVQWLAEAWGLRPFSYPLTAFTMSVFPSIGQSLCIYLGIVDIRRYWWVVPLGIGFFVMDTAPDVWYRSNELLFNSWQQTLGSLYITLVYFTIGSEGFMSVGLGVFMATAGPALVQLGKFFEQFLVGLSAVFAALRVGFSAIRDAIWTPEDEETMSVRPPVQNVPGGGRPRGEGR